MIKLTKEKYISLLITIAAVVIFTLPFWLPEKEIFIYSAKQLTEAEQGYISELQKEFYKRYIGARYEKIILPVYELVMRQCEEEHSQRASQGTL